jgi:hypothetical protein
MGRSFRPRSLWQQSTKKGLLFFGLPAYPAVIAIAEIHVLLSNHCETTLLLVMCRLRNPRGFGPELLLAAPRRKQALPPTANLV